MSFKLLHNGRQ